MTKKFWRIVGYDSTSKIFERRLPFGVLSETEVERLLQRLVCRHLTSDEITDGSLRRSNPAYRPLLELRRERSGKFSISAGDNPHYIVSLVSEEKG